MAPVLRLGRRGARGHQDDGGEGLPRRGRRVRAAERGARGQERGHRSRHTRRGPPVPGARFRVVPFVGLCDALRRAGARPVRRQHRHRSVQGVQQVPLLLPVPVHERRGHRDELPGRPSHEGFQRPD